MRLIYAIFLWILAASHATADEARSAVLLSADEIELALLHGPWPQEFAPDPSNKVSGNPAAISFGQTLFSSVDLSSNGGLSCASCHQADLGFSDGLPRAQGRVVLDRNTPSLLNLRANRWFGWAGQSDSLWAQSILPVLEADELNLTKEQVAAKMAAAPFAADYRAVFGPLESDEQVLVNVGKALAAYQETLTTGETEFDRFLKALRAENWDAAATYPESAQRGLSFFLGQGNCSFCHSGPSFTNGEFHDAGVPYFIEAGRVDTGRFGGIERLKLSPFTLDGAYSDDPKKTGAWAVRQVQKNHADFGKFKVPSLRNLARSAPYMHNGSLPDLEAVVDHYSNINIERLHADGEAILVPLSLSEGEKEDLLNFLRSLESD